MARSRLYRFLDKIRDGPGDCWEWAGHINPNGYGSCKHNGVQTVAHRAAWELMRGPIPDTLYVLHRCDVRSCVNPKHLFLGTQADNKQDEISKNRNYKLLKTQCSKGHPYTDANTHHTKNGRRCKICQDRMNHENYIRRTSG